MIEIQVCQQTCISIGQPYKATIVLHRRIKHKHLMVTPLHTYSQFVRSIYNNLLLTLVLALASKGKVGSKSP